MSSLKLLVRRLKSIFVPNSFDQVNIFYSSTCASKYAGSSSPVHGNEPPHPQVSLRRFHDFALNPVILVPNIH